MQCRYGGAVHGSRTVWGAACVEREEGGEAAGGRLHTAMALLGLKVFFGATQLLSLIGDTLSRAYRL